MIFESTSEVSVLSLTASTQALFACLDDAHLILGYVGVYLNSTMLQSELTDQVPRWPLAPFQGDTRSATRMVKTSPCAVQGRLQGNVNTGTQTFVALPCDLFSAQRCGVLLSTVQLTDVGNAASRLQQISTLIANSLATPLSPLLNQLVLATLPTTPSQALAVANNYFATTEIATFLGFLEFAFQSTGTCSFLCIFSFVRIQAHPCHSETNCNSGYRIRGWHRRYSLCQGVVQRAHTNHQCANG